MKAKYTLILRMSGFEKKIKMDSVVPQVHVPLIFPVRLKFEEYSVTHEVPKDRILVFEHREQIAPRTFVYTFKEII